MVDRGEIEIVKIGARQLYNLSKYFWKLFEAVLSIQIKFIIDIGTLLLKI